MYWKTSEKKYIIYLWCQLTCQEGHWKFIPLPRLWLWTSKFYDAPCSTLERSNGWLESSWIHGIMDPLWGPANEECGNTSCIVVVHGLFQKQWLVNLSPRNKALWYQAYYEPLGSGFLIKTNLICIPKTLINKVPWNGVISSTGWVIS